MSTLFPLIALEDDYVCSDCGTTSMLETQEKDGDVYRYYVMCKDCGRYLEVQKYTEGKHRCPIAHCQAEVVIEVRERKDRKYNKYLLCNNCSFIFGGEAGDAGADDSSAEQGENDSSEEVPESEDSV
jgi:predicted RNA-binding Zn-ribbon protein involved in translation (DUF1610 family)